MLTRRRLLNAAALAVAAAIVPAAAARTSVRLVVPFPPGGGGDTIARSLVDTFKRLLTRDVWVDNRPGAGGSLGTNAVVQAKDATIGYVTNGIMCVNQHLYPLRFNPLADLKPVGQISRIGLIVAINPKALPEVKDLKSLIAYAKAHPGKLNFASSGKGTTSHLAGKCLERTAGLSLVHIPYRGGAAAMLDLLSGRIPLMIDVAPNVLPYVQSGRLVALAVTTDARLEQLPDVPTAAELGLPDLTLYAWDGFVAPRGTTDEQIEKLSQALATTLADPEVRRKLIEKGAEPRPSSARDFADFIRDEAIKWKTLVESIDTIAQ